jgi:hypothetical protein
MNLKTKPNKVLQAENLTIEHHVENIVLILSLLTVGYYWYLEAFM